MALKSAAGLRLRLELHTSTTEGLPAPVCSRTGRGSHRDHLLITTGWNGIQNHGEANPPGSSGQGDQSRLISHYKKSNCSPCTWFCPASLQFWGVVHRDRASGERAGWYFQPPLLPAFSLKQYFAGYRHKCWQEGRTRIWSELDFESELLERGSVLGSVPVLPLLENGGRERRRGRGREAPWNSLNLNAVVI